MLYIKFHPKLLLNFLKNSEDYPIPVVEQKCREAGLREAQAFLMIKGGEVKKGIRVLTRKTTLTIKELVEMAIEFGVNGD